MKASFIILALSDLLLLFITAVTGSQVHGTDGFARHFLLGLLSAMFTCLVHIVAFMYFVVCVRITEQAIRGGQDAEDIRRRAVENKRKALRAAAAGLLSVMLAAVFGAAIETGAAEMIHLLAAYLAIFVNMAAFFVEFGLIERNRVLFNAAFPAGPESASDAREMLGRHDAPVH